VNAGVSSAYAGGVASREDVGSWLAGPPGAGASNRLGLPTAGPGSKAPLWRRAIALLIDWLIAWQIAGFLAKANVLAPPAVLFVMNVVLVASLGFTIGHRLLGIQVRVLPLDERGYVGFRRASVRAILLLLFIPAVVWDGDGRGLHDRAAGTVITRR
jgi:hypothetical protein